MLEHSTDESLVLAEELFDAFNDHDVDRLEELASESFVGTGPDSEGLRLGPQGAREWASAYFSAFPDSKWTKERGFGHGDLFVLQVMYTGTHDGAFAAAQTIVPARKHVSVPATFVGRAHRGKIEELRGYWDQLAALRQLGPEDGHS